MITVGRDFTTRKKQRKKKPADQLCILERFIRLSCQEINNFLLHDFQNTTKAVTKSEGPKKKFDPSYFDRFLGTCSLLIGS